MDFKYLFFIYLFFINFFFYSVKLLHHCKNEIKDILNNFFKIITSYELEIFMF